MKKLTPDQMAAWGAWMARNDRENQAPRSFRIKRQHSGKRNLEQECARRRRFHKIHGTAIGGGQIWPE